MGGRVLNQPGIQSAHSCVEQSRVHVVVHTYGSRLYCVTTCSDTSVSIELWQHVKLRQFAHPPEIKLSPSLRQLRQPRKVSNINTQTLAPTLLGCMLYDSYRTNIGNRFE